MVTSGFHIKIWNQSFTASFVMFPSLQDLTGPVLRLSTCQGTGVALRVAEVLLQKQALPVVMREGPWHLPRWSPAQLVAAAAAAAATELVRVPHLPLTASVLPGPVPRVAAGTASPTP